MHAQVSVADARSIICLSRPEMTLTDADAHMIRQVCTHVCMYVLICMPVCVCMCMRMFVCMYVRICMYV
jgi:hypothetical protein